MMNRLRMLALGTVATASVALAAGSASGQVLSGGESYTVGIDASGELVAWGRNNAGQTSPVPSGTNFVAVEAGTAHSLALRSNGTVVAWGSDHGFSAGSGPTSGVPAPVPGNPVIAISGGGAHSMILRADGSVVSWGLNVDNQVPTPANLPPAKAISAGGSHSVALLQDGRVHLWGGLAGDELNPPPTSLTDAGSASFVPSVAISSGNTHTLSLRQDGSVVGWGTGAHMGNAPVGLTAVAISAGGGNSLVLKSDGTVQAWGTAAPAPLTSAATANVVYVVAADTHFYYVQSDGTINSWGSSANGERATPSGFALPTTVRWASATSGDYLNSHLWEQKIPSTALSTAIFDKAGSIDVNFGNNARASALDITAGNVTFNLNGNQYIVTTDVDVAANTTLALQGAVSAQSIANAGTLNFNGSVTATVGITNSGLMNFGTAVASTSINSLTNSETLVTAGTVTTTALINDGLLAVATGGKFSVTGTALNAGQVDVADGGSFSVNQLNNEGAINIADGGELVAGSITSSGDIVNDGTLAGSLTLLDGGKLSGVGALSGLSRIGDGGIIAPGSSIGALTGTEQEWLSGGTFEFEINDALGTAGGLNGWDVLQLSGSLMISSTSSNPFTVDIRSLAGTTDGEAANFNPMQNYNWGFVTAAGGIEGFSSNLFAITSSGFSNPTDGTFTVTQDGNSLFVNYITAVPEPSSFVVLGIAGLGLAGFRHRRRRRLTAAVDSTLASNDVVATPDNVLCSLASSGKL
jgi:hypothetical protein